MNDTTAYEAAFPNRKLTGIDQRIAGVIAELHALADEMDSTFRVFPEARVAEAVSPSEEVEETAVCAACGRVEDALCKTGARVHDETFSIVNCSDVSHHAFLEPRPTPSSPSEPTVGYYQVEGEQPAANNWTPFQLEGRPLGLAMEARSANTAVDERPSTVTSDGETAEVCDADASHRHVDAEGNYIWHRHSHQEPSKADPLGVKGFDEYNHHDPAEHSGVERVDAHGWIGEPYAGAPKPVEAAPVEPLEGEWRRVSELLGHGVWDINHGTHGETVRVPLAVEQAIAAHFAMEQYDLLKARAERAEERASTAERRLEGHENLAVAAIRERDGMERMWLMTEDVLRETRAERDEARGEVERLQAALTRIRDKSSVPCGICPVDAPCSNCIARRALMEARVSTPVREERGE